MYLCDIHIEMKQIKIQKKDLIRYFTITQCKQIKHTFKSIQICVIIVLKHVLLKNKNVKSYIQNLLSIGNDI